MNSSFPLAVASLAVSLSTTAVCQGLVATNAAERRSTRLHCNVGVSKPGEIYLHYGPATWRESHGPAVVSKLEGRFRLGTGFWAALHTNVDLELGGKKVPANIWYLGLHRSANADWSLMIMDSSKIARSGRTSGDTRDVKPDIDVPMRLERGLPRAGELSIEFSVDDKAFNRGSLKLRWGEFQLSAPLRVDIVETKPADEPPFKQLDPARAVTTESGLQYEELRPGIGKPPRAEDNVEVHYVGWHADGTRFDSSFLRKQPAVLPVNGVIRGWREGLLLMKPGAVFRLRIPPDLGYDERGAGPIGANATLEFWVELRSVK